MPAITLPDGSVRSYPHPVTPAEVAADIGPGLAKAAFVAKVDGSFVDLDRRIEHDAQLALVTRKDEAALAHIRHDCAHVLAEDRKSVVEGQSVSVRVDLGGRRIIIKKKQTNKT